MYISSGFKAIYNIKPQKISKLLDLLKSQKRVKMPKKSLIILINS